MPVAGGFQSIFEDQGPTASGVTEAVRRARRDVEQESSIQRSLVRQQLQPGIQDIASRFGARGTFFSSETGRQVGEFTRGISQQEASIQRELARRLADLSRFRAQSFGVPIEGIS